MSEEDGAREILVKTRDLLSERARWTKDAEARNAWGSRVSATEPSAACWCLSGAQEYAARSIGATTGSYLESWVAIARAVEGDPVRFNDAPHTTHADVLRALDAAIANLPPPPGARP